MRKVFALVLPCLSVGWFGNGTGNPAGVVFFVKIAHECWVAQFEFFFFSEPSAEFHGGPMRFSCERGIVDEGEDFLVDFVSLKQAWTPRPGSVSEPVDALVVKSLNPKLKCSFADASVLEGDIERAIAQEKMNDVEPMMGLLIRTAFEGRFKLLERTVFTIRKMTRPWDSP